MTSILKVDNIKDSANNQAIAISSGNMTVAGNTTFTGSVTGDNNSLVKLSSSTVSNVTSVDFNSSLITDAYNTYKIIGTNVSPRSQSQNPFVLPSIDNGANFNLNTKNARFFSRLYSTATGGEYEASSVSLMRIGTSLFNASDRGSEWDLTLYNLRSTTFWKHMTGFCIGALGSGDGYNWRSSGQIETQSAVNFIRLKMASGNMDGKFTLYGVKE